MMRSAASHKIYSVYRRQFYFQFREIRLFAVCIKMKQVVKHKRHRLNFIVKSYLFLRHGKPVAKRKIAGLFFYFFEFSVEYVYLFRRKLDYLSGGNDEYF